jgi:hypothetical protein
MTVELKRERDRRPNRTAVERMIELSRARSVKLPAGETVEAQVREMRLSRNATTVRALRAADKGKGKRLHSASALFEDLGI